MGEKVALEVDDPLQERLEILGEFLGDAVRLEHAAEAFVGKQADGRDPVAIPERLSDLGSGHAALGKLDGRLDHLLFGGGHPLRLDRRERPVGPGATLSAGVDSGHGRAPRYVPYLTHVGARYRRPGAPIASDDLLRAFLYNLWGVAGERTLTDQEEFVVTPYEVKGRIDYAKLREQFGTQDLGAPILDRLQKLAGGELPPLLTRGVYYSHRDLNLILDRYALGHPFFLYSGRGPSGPLHISHLVPFELCRWLQEKLGVEMYIQITDDEKFWARAQLTREDSVRWGYENLLDILAVGFDPKRTHVFFDSRSIAALYPLAIRVARKIPYSTVKAVFGFPPSTNIGLVFYTALQTVPCFYPSWESGTAVPCLIPCGIDQDPHFRVTRDIAEGLGYPKPALLHSQMIPGLLGEGVMSTTGNEKDNALFLNDPPKVVERKIRRAFTGGRASVEEQRRLGANPEICSVWALWKTRFAPDAKEFEQITADCRSGALLCGDCKSNLLEKVHAFYRAHGEAREKVRSWAESTIITQAPKSD